MNQDLAFIRLSPTLAEAKRLGDSPIAHYRDLNKYDMVCLSPNNFYLQQTNVEGGIAFDEDYNVFLTDDCGNELANITPSVYISEFTDGNGLPQLRFEINRIGVDFYGRKLLLKFIKPNTSVVYWSTPLLVTDMYFNECVTLDYGSPTFDDNSNIDTADYLQRIGLKTYMNDISPTQETKEYAQFNGRIINSDMQIYHKWDYKFQYCNNINYFAILAALSQSVVYIQGAENSKPVRITNKPVPKKGERIGQTNWFEVDFTAVLDFSDTYTPQLQITPIFDLIFVSPQGSYTIASLPDTLNGFFNKNVQLGTGTIKLYKDNVLFATFTETDINIASQFFDVDWSALGFVNGSYRYEISDGLFLSVNSDVYYGGIFEFTIGEADWLSGDWNSNDFFTG